MRIKGYDIDSDPHTPSSLTTRSTSTSRYIVFYTCIEVLLHYIIPLWFYIHVSQCKCMEVTHALVFDPIVKPVLANYDIFGYLPTTAVWGKQQ